jgi:alpha-mannosidase
MSSKRRIWAIGSYDKSFFEFAIAGKPENYSKVFPFDVNFIIGKSEADKNWPYIHPGPTDWAGNRTHPFKIIFELNERVEGEAELNIAYIDVVRHMWGRPYLDDGPLYIVNVNGFTLETYFPPGSGSNKTESLWDDKKGKYGILKIPFSSSLLKLGQNCITLTVEEEGWLIYDALWLEVDESKRYVNFIKEVDVKDTPLFKKEDGILKQAIEVTIYNSGFPQKGKITLELDNLKVELNEEIKFGNTIRYVLVPELKDEKRGVVEVEIEGQKIEKEFIVGPRKKWLLFLAPASHTDIGYTTIQPHVAEVHSRNIDIALEACKSTTSFKWNIEVSWHLRDFMKKRKEKMNDLTRFMKEGRIGLQALYTNLLTGLCSHEALNRACYFSNSVSKKYGIPLNSAMLTDIPSAIWTLPMVLANSGIKYYAQGINQERGPFFRYSDIKSPFYWEGPDGSKVLTWFALHYGIRQAAKTGLLEGYRQTLRRIQQFVSNFEKDYPYNAILVYGTFADNHPLDAKFAMVAEEWNKNWEYPKVIVATLDEFFRYIEKEFKDRIPTYRGNPGSYWEDGVASTAFETALHRENQRDIILVEKINSLVASLTSLSKYPKPMLDLAWEMIHLYNEHTWGDAYSGYRPDGRVVNEQWKIKKSFAHSGKLMIERMLEDSLCSLASLVRGSRHYSILFFNPHSWRRDDVVDIIVSSPPFVMFGQNFKILDCRNNKLISYQIVEEGAGTLFRTPNYVMNRVISLFLEDVPSVGYVCVDIIPFSEEYTVEPSVSFFEWGMENQYYKIEIDTQTGAIKSIYDKEIGEELVDKNSQFKLNQYLYLAGGEGTQAVSSEQSLPKPEFKVYTNKNVRISKGSNGPIFGSIIIESDSYNTPLIRTEIRLYSKIKRISIINKVVKNETLEKEGIYFSFPFAIENPEIRFEIPNGFTRPEKEQLKGGCKDWYAIQDWVSISNNDFTIIWNSVDAPLVSIGDINVGKWLEKLEIRKGHLFAYVMNNYWYTNYKASQGGEFEFKFNITSYKGESDNVKNTKFGWDASKPLAYTFLIPNKDGILPHGELSFLKVDKENVALLAFKPAEDDEGFIIRLIETERKDTTARLTFPFHELKEAYKCNLVEERISKLEIVENGVDVPLKAGGVTTIMVKLVKRD